MCTGSELVVTKAQDITKRRLSLSKVFFFFFLPLTSFIPRSLSYGDYDLSGCVYVCELWLSVGLCVFEYLCLYVCLCNLSAIDWKEPQSVIKWHLNWRGEPLEFDLAHDIQSNMANVSMAFSQQLNELIYFNWLALYIGSLFSRICFILFNIYIYWLHRQLDELDSSSIDAEN